MSGTLLEEGESQKLTLFPLFSLSLSPSQFSQALLFLSLLSLTDILTNRHGRAYQGLTSSKSLSINSFSFIWLFSFLCGFYAVKVKLAYQIKMDIFVILQFTENAENFFKRFGFESISNLLLNIF